MPSPDPLIPEWPAPANIRAAYTTRIGGVSRAPYGQFNLAAHVGDDPAAVRDNRARLRDALALPGEPVWLDQVHGVTAIDAAGGGASADAGFTDRAGVVCAVLTADCLPVLLCDRRGTRVAAVHAGWRGLVNGVIEAAIERLDLPGASLLAWLGPAIGPSAFEVGAEVRSAFISHDPAADAAFVATRPGHWHADLYQLARLRLRARGVDAVYGGGLCTYSDSGRFYSYRRDGATGRMASLIWIK